MANNRSALDGEKALFVCTACPRSRSFTSDRKPTCFLRTSVPVWYNSPQRSRSAITKFDSPDSLRVPYVDHLVPSGGRSPARLAPERIVTANYKLTMLAHHTSASQIARPQETSAVVTLVHPNASSHIVRGQKKLLCRMWRPENTPNRVFVP